MSEVQRVDDLESITGSSQLSPTSRESSCVGDRVTEINGLAESSHRLCMKEQAVRWGCESEERRSIEKHQEINRDYDKDFSELRKGHKDNRQSGDAKEEKVMEKNQEVTQECAKELSGFREEHKDNRQSWATEEVNLMDKHQEVKQKGDKELSELHKEHKATRQFDDAEEEKLIEKHQGVTQECDKELLHILRDNQVIRDSLGRKLGKLHDDVCSLVEVEGQGEKAEG